MQATAQSFSELDRLLLMPAFRLPGLDGRRGSDTDLRAKRSCFIIDREGIIRYSRVEDPRGLLPNDELLEILDKLR